MLPYIFLYLFIMLFGLWHTKKNINLKHGILFFIVFIFSALRFDVGWDYGNYYDIIFNLKGVNFEPATPYLIEFSKYVDFTQLFFIVTSYIIVYGVHYALKHYSKDYVVSLLIFVSVPLFYMNSFSIIRQYCAIAIVLYGIKYILRKQLLPYLITIAFASMFHYSAIAGLLIYFLNKLSLNKVTSVVLILVSLFQNLISIENISRYSYLAHLGDPGNGAQLVRILFLLLAIIFIAFSNAFKTPESKFYYNVFIVGVCIFNVTFSIGEQATRVSLYFIIYLILLVPELSYRFKKKQFYLVVIMFTISLYSTTLYFSYTNPYKNHLTPYQIFLYKDITDLK